MATKLTSEQITARMAAETEAALGLSDEAMRAVLAERAGRAVHLDGRPVEATPPAPLTDFVPIDDQRCPACGAENERTEKGRLVLLIRNTYHRTGAVAVEEGNICTGIDGEHIHQACQVCGWQGLMGMSE